MTNERKSPEAVVGTTSGGGKRRSLFVATTVGGRRRGWVVKPNAMGRVGVLRRGPLLHPFRSVGHRQLRAYPYEGEWIRLLTSLGP